MASDPTELVSCGKCGNVNTVPFGLDKFKCFSCGVMVAVAREPKAACAAASATAMYYNDLSEDGRSKMPSQTAAPPSSSSSSEKRRQKSTSDGAPTSSGGFFGKLQKTFDTSMKKVDKTISSLTQPKAVGSDAGSYIGGAPLAGKTALPPSSTTTGSEEEQMQWALSASLLENQQPPGSPTVAAAVVPQQSGNAGDQLQVAATQVAERLRVAEERAAQAERELEGALAKEASAVAERGALRQQLDENEDLVASLTQQLDTVNSRLEERSRHCKAYESALVSARQAAAIVTASKDQKGDELECHGAIAQLLCRIAELEATPLHATHFAPDGCGGSGGGGEGKEAVLGAAAGAAAAPAAVPVVSDLERGLQLSRQQAQARSAAEDELPPPAATMEAAAAAPGVTASSSSPPPPDESAAPADAKPTLAEPIESPAASIVAEPEAEVKDILGQPYSCAFGNGPALVEAVPAAGGTASTAPAVAAEEPVEVALAPPSTAAESAAPAAAAAAEPPAVGASESAAAAAHLASDPAADNTEAAKPVVEPPGRADDAAPAAGAAPSTLSPPEDELL